MSIKRRKMIKRLCYLCFCALFLGAIFCGSNQTVTVYGATQSLAECVAEVSSKRILWQKNAQNWLPMASTTKILTAITIIEDCDLSEIVTVPLEAQGVEGSSVYLHAGDKYTVEELLYGLMLRSGNDCAVALAIHHSRSIKAFAQAMNEKASTMGAEESLFVNPHGLPDKRHRTTARDLCLISAYALENPTFLKIVSCKYYSPRGWKNKNKMLERYEGAVGVKTGFTLKAGRCLVTAAQRNDMTLVCVVLNSPQMYERTQELLDCAFEQYSLVQLCDTTQGYEGMNVRSDFYYPLTQTEREKVRYQTVKEDDFAQEEGNFIGQMKIYLENDLLFSQNLYMMKG